MKTFIITGLLLFGMLRCVAQNVAQAEYFLDEDAGFGNNNIITLLNPQPDGTYDFTVNLAGVSIGYHKLYLRIKDSDGKWGQTSRRNIQVISSNFIKTITAAEYFMDTDPGFNNATQIPVNPQVDDIQQNFTSNLSGLSVGYHKLYIRTKDIDGNWGITSRRNAEVINPRISVISAAEYFFNTDPGVGKAKQSIFTNPAADGSFAFKIPVDEIPSGAHTLYLRVKDSVNNNWGLTQRQQDSVVTSAQPGKWSNPATWSNNKVPGANTVVLLYHNVAVDILDAVCKSLTPYRNNVSCIVEAGKALHITGRR